MNKQYKHKETGIVATNNGFDWFYDENNNLINKSHIEKEYEPIVELENSIDIVFPFIKEKSNKKFPDIDWKVNISATIENINEISKEDMEDIVEFVNDFTNEKYNKTTDGVKYIYYDNKVKFDIEFSVSTHSQFALNDSMEGIKNILKWFETVLEDRSWDYRYIIDVLKFKISDTCKYIEKTQRHENWSRDVKYMKLALSLIKKIWGGDEFNMEDITTYDSEWHDYHVSEYNWTPCEDEDFDDIEDEETKEQFKGSVRMDIEEISENFDEYFNNNKLTYKKAISYLNSDRGNTFCDKESKIVRAMVISKLKHEKAMKLLFRILEEHIQNWWD